MNLQLVVVIAVASASLVECFNANNGYSLWLTKKHVQRTAAIGMGHFNMLRKHDTRMSMAVEESPSTTEPAPASAQQLDFSKFTVGQEYEGTLISAMAFGIFVDISTGVNVLLPRSVLSRVSYDKLKKLADSKSKDLVKVQLIEVNATNQTLTGKYISPNYQDRADVSSLADKDLSGKVLKATVVGAHDFGIFVELDDYGVQGLVPSSKLSSKMNGDKIRKEFPVGVAVDVKIDTVDPENNKLVLSMRGAKTLPALSALAEIPHDKWIQGVVESATDFGLFVRPVGHEFTGLVHASRVPRGLTAALKSRIAAAAEAAPGTVVAGTDSGETASSSASSASSDSSDSSDTAANTNTNTNAKRSINGYSETLFGAGDVVRVRVHAANLEADRLELSMLPYRSATDDEDGYVPEGRDIEEEEAEDRFRASLGDPNDQVEVSSYDPEDTLIWWRGAEFVKSSALPGAKNAGIDEEFDVLNESLDIVEGTWRRMFELDMRKDQADFSSKAVQEELKELAAEIGELEGLDVDLVEVDRAGAAPYGSAKLGSFVARSSLPEEWQEELEFFKEEEEIMSPFNAKLRAGKAGDAAELAAMVRDLEAEAENRKPRAPAPAPTPPAAAVAPVMVQEDTGTDADASSTDSAVAAPDVATPSTSPDDVLSA